MTLKFYVNIEILLPITLQQRHFSFRHIILFGFVLLRYMIGSQLNPGTYLITFSARLSRCEFCVVILTKSIP